jgi:hypothetical protein
MTVGNSMSMDSVNQGITNLSVAMRNLMQAVQNLSLNVNGQGNGVALLEALGFDSADAAAAQGAISYLNTIAGVYFGTASQGTDYDFNQALSQYWGGN